MYLSSALMRKWPALQRTLLVAPSIHNIYHSPSHCISRHRVWLRLTYHSHSWCVCVCVCVCTKSHQSRPTLCNPVDHSLSGSSLHGILQARILEWVAVPSRGSSQPRDRTWVCYISCISRPPRVTWEDPHSCYRPQMSYIYQNNSLLFTMVTHPIKIQLRTLDGLEKNSSFALDGVVYGYEAYSCRSQSELKQASLGMQLTHSREEEMLEK